MNLQRHLLPWMGALIPTSAALGASLLAGDWRPLAFVGGVGLGFAGTISVLYATEHVFERLFSIDERVEERVRVVGRGEGDRVPVTDPPFADPAEF